MLGTSVFVVGYRRRSRWIVGVAVNEVRGCEAVQKDTGLVEEVESLENISVSHARWIRYLVFVLALVLTHDSTVGIERR